jgi:hypothetical protein
MTRFFFFWKNLEVKEDAWGGEKMTRRTCAYILTLNIPPYPHFPHILGAVTFFKVNKLPLSPMPTSENSSGPFMFCFKTGTPQYIKTISRGPHKMVALLHPAVSPHTLGWF